MTPCAAVPLEPSDQTTALLRQAGFPRNPLYLNAAVAHVAAKLTRQSGLDRSAIAASIAAHFGLSFVTLEAVTE